MCKAICGVAAGACNCAINVHWAKGSDISDINAKSGAQQTVSGAVGLLFAGLFAKAVSTVPTTILWFLYACLTLLHVLSNMKCMKLVAFDHFNTSRMDIAVEQFLERVQLVVSKESKDDHDDEKDPPQIPTIDCPVELSKKEPLFMMPKFMLTSPIVSMGVSFDSLVQQSTDQIEIDRCVQDLCDQGFTLSLSGSKKKKINIALAQGASPAVKAKAYFYGQVMRKLLMDQSDSGSTSSSANRQILEAIDASSALWAIFQESATKTGWDLDKTALKESGYEISIKSMQ